MARVRKKEAPVAQATVSKIIGLEHVEMGRVVPFQFGNPRKMRPRMNEVLTNSITELGFVEPIVGRRVGDKVEILNGHHRFDALKAMGEKTIPVTIVDAPDDTKAKAMALSLNRISADWSSEELNKYVTDILKDEGASVSWVADVTGFSGAEVDVLKYDSAGFLDDMINEDEQGQGNKTFGTPLKNVKEGEQIGFFLDTPLKLRFYAALKEAKRLLKATTTHEAVVLALEYVAKETDHALREGSTGCVVQGIDHHVPIPVGGYRPVCDRERGRHGYDLWIRVGGFLYGSGAWGTGMVERGWILLRVWAGIVG